MNYYFDKPDRPTEFNIGIQLRASGFVQSNQVDNCDFSDQHLQLDEKACEQLEYKEQLARLCTQHCPHIIPASFAIDYLSAMHVTEQLPSHCRWIVKPALMNNGEGIVLCKDRQAIVKHFTSKHCYAGPHIVQQYIEPPHLMQGHKYSIRLFLVLTNANASYLYPHGYFNVAKQAYRAGDFSDPRAHLTNEHLSMKEQPDSIQIPTTRAPHFGGVFDDLKHIIQLLLQAHQQSCPDFYRPQSASALSLFGVDFMLNADLRPWLLEVNHGPCFPIDPNHVLQTHLYNAFWQHLREDIILPIATQRAIQANRFIELK